MESKKKIFKPKVLSIAKQISKIKKDYKNIEIIHSNSYSFNLIINVKPTPLSEIYKVKLFYKIGENPDVFIIEPTLCEDIKIPHTYEKNKLCLFYPKNKEWTKYDYISDKIIPWISEWLYFYENWEITGKWMGEGMHPKKNKKSKKYI